MIEDDIEFILKNELDGWRIRFRNRSMFSSPEIPLYSASMMGFIKIHAQIGSPPSTSVNFQDCSSDQNICFHDPHAVLSG